MRTPKDELGNVDHAEVYRLFMSSSHTEWVPFAEEMGWNPGRSRSEFPVRKWTDEKKQILGQAAAEQIADLVFHH